ncbi:hypothetical protein STCU_10490 [Strigomonas culicis]|uniref:Uncharacterized protein n=1 Tax=Strigomonas culicis TaxID=28005 RepID=S9THZ1_9TRYP|nr:hypothetical protein STCU_10490 [Strigomonas culicis]|eukprot:EPY17657.1 hypothetical protein STCU_10490 [Strigomonas culicis]
MYLAVVLFFSLLLFASDFFLRFLCSFFFYSSFLYPPFCFLQAPQCVHTLQHESNDHRTGIAGSGARPTAALPFGAEPY